MLTAVAAAFLCDPSSPAALPQLGEWLGVLALDNYPRPQFCSHFTDGNSTRLPPRNGVRLTFVIVCKMLRDSLEEGAIQKEMHKEIHQLSFKIMGVGAPQGYKFGWNVTKVVKIKSCLILHKGGIHLASDPVPVTEKDFHGSWTKPLSIWGLLLFFFLIAVVIICYS